MSICCAIIVSYHPDPEILQKAVAAAGRQVDRVYLIDNGSGPAVEEIFRSQEKVETLSLAQNFGIAAAFNIGIERARRSGCDYVLLLDQDSIAPPGMVQRYVAAMHKLRENGVRVAALGPRCRDPRTGHISRFVRYRWFRNAHTGGDLENHIVPADFLISSGSFYDTRVFAEVGLFDENLFIDHVDTEWFHRARKKGFQCFGLWNVVLDHRLGEGRVRLWLLRWRSQPLHRPFRLYYIVRNSLLLYRMPHVPWKWISGDGLRLLRLLVLYMLFSPQRRATLCWTMRGLHDGVRGVGGPSPTPPDERRKEVRVRA